MSAMEKHYTIAQIVEQTGFPESAVRAAIESGELLSVQLAERGTHNVPASALEEWIRQHREEAETKARTRAERRARRSVPMPQGRRVARQQRSSVLALLPEGQALRLS